MKDYRTVQAASEVELVVQKSRFIGRCFPANTEEQALSFLDEVRKRHHDATHNCYAYAIGGAGGAARFSDDGEPGGTAGLPMMEVVRQKGVTDLLVVVTRYFGGVLLGAGGLVRAYSKASSAAIEHAQPVWMRACMRYEVQVDYARWGAVETLLRQHGQVKDIAYTHIVCAQVVVPLGGADAFGRAVVERTDGQVHPVERGVCCEPFAGEELHI